jgi:hypothetical protein
MDCGAKLDKAPETATEKKPVKRTTKKAKAD